MYIFKITDLIFLAPELFILFSLFLSVLYFSAYAGRHMHESHFMTMHAYLCLFIFIACLLNVLLTIEFPCSISILHNYLRHDYFSTTIKFIIFSLALIMCLLSRPYYKVLPSKSYEYVVILGIAIISSAILVAVIDLIGLFVTMEVLSFCLYALAGSRFRSPFSSEAATKYFIQGSFASGVFVFGSSLFYMITGLTNYIDIKRYLEECYAIIHSNPFDFMFLFSSMLIMLSLFFFKIAAVPFHSWIADVYEGSPLPITAFFSVVIKFTMTMTLVRILGTFYTFIMSYLTDVFLFYGVVSILLGTFAACAEQRIKRVLAYSSINHTGYLLIGFIPASSLTLSSVIEYAFVYALTNIVIFAFLILCIVESETGAHKQLVFVSDLSLLTAKNYLYNMCVSFAFFSSAGLPPFAGFCIKYNILYNLLHFTHYGNTVVIPIVLFSVFSVYYYLRFIKCIFFSSNLKEIELNYRHKLVQFVMLCIALFIIVYPFIQIYINTITLELSATVMNS